VTEPHIRQGRRSQNSIAPGRTHDNVAFSGASRTGPASSGQPNAEDLVAGSMGVELRAPPEPGKFWPPQLR
jgi:hypothetical protein